MSAWGTENINEIKETAVSAISLTAKYKESLLSITEEVYGDSIYRFHRLPVSLSLSTLAAINYPFEKFSNLSKVSRNTLVKRLSRGMDDDLVRGYLYVFDLTESRAIEFLSAPLPIRDMDTGVRVFQYPYSIMKASLDFERFIDFDASNYGYMCGYAVQNDNRESIMTFLTALLLLSKKYGEGNVIEALTRCYAENEYVSLVTLARLVSDWSNLKEYPLPWSLSLVSTDEGDV